MAKQESELSVITKAKDLCAYVTTVTQKSPKQFRYTYVIRLQNLALDIVENLFRANAIYPVSTDQRKRRLDFQEQAMVDAQMLAYFAEVAMGQGCILMKQYEQIARLTTDCRFMTAAWVSSDKKRFRP